jgi:hypothetical protein
VCTNLRDGCRENNNFIQLTNSLHKRIDAWSLDDIYIVILAFDFHGNGEISLMKDLDKYQYIVKTG